MDFRELKLLVSRGESETLELKTSFKGNELGKALCALLNTKGGTVLVGVKNDGRIEGQQVSDKTLQDLGLVLGKIEPTPPVEHDRVEIPGKKGLEVLVLKASARDDLVPFSYDGRPFRRLGSETQKMPQEQYAQLLTKRTSRPSAGRWENLPAAAVEISDLDEALIRKTEALAIQAGRIPSGQSSSALEILERLDLVLDGRLVHAAVVAFGRFGSVSRLRADFPQCSLQMARFRGIDKGEFLDQRQIRANAFEQLDEAMLFLHRHLPVAGRIQPGLFEREDEPLFPVEALREALVNALCHRDYISPGGSVQVAIFDDRLEIWSPGLLPPELSVEDLRAPHRSIPRNPVLAEVFYRRGLIEKWGRGTQKIIELCLLAGHPDPEFMETSGAFVVRFLPSGYIAPHRVALDLTDRQREILQLLARDQEKPLREILEELSESGSKRVTQKDLQYLRNIGLVVSIGRGRGAVYRLASRD